MFKIEKSVKQLDSLIENLPNQNEVFKFISVSGGFSSISFIKYISEFESIHELYATTLRVGKKEVETIENLNIEKCFFIVCTIMQESTGKVLEYFNLFKDKCLKNKWKFAVINNHSKIILIKTENNFYVLETSSNLNENPKIEQFSFENSKELFEWYRELITGIIDKYS